MTYNVKTSNRPRIDIKPKYRYMLCTNARVKACSENKMIKYDGIENTLLNELPEILENHSPVAEKDELTTLKGAMNEIEEGIGRLVDAIRFRGFDTSIGEALDSLEGQRKALTAEMIEANQRASKTTLEAHIQNLVGSLRARESVAEINTTMRLVFRSIVVDPNQHAIQLTLVDGSQTFIAI